jgi:hypothetical protein
MQTKTPGVTVGGSINNPPTADFLGAEVACNVPVGSIIRQGSCWCLDLSQVAMAPSAAQGSGVVQLFQPVGFSPTATVGVPTWSVNAGKLLGVYQGATFTTTIAFQPINVQNTGLGVVLMSAEAATAVNVNSNLLMSVAITGGHVGARAAAFAAGTQVGQATSAPVNTTFTGPVGAGSNSVVLGSNTIIGATSGIPLANIYGITTTTVLLVDTIQSGVQEAVTPSAIVSGVNANQTLTVAAIAAGTTMTTTINGIISLPYTTTAADTATTAAANIIQNINNTPGMLNFILPPVNAAGVITVRAIQSGTAYNSMTITASAVGGTATFVAGGATLASGTNSTFTATFANAHGSGQIPVQGIFKTAGSAIIPGTASALTESLGTAYLQIV